MEFANPFAVLLMGVLAAFILYNIRRGNLGRQLFIREVPGVAAIDEVVGRAVELGRPVLFSTGLGGIDIVTLQAITVIGHVTKLAARFRTRVIVPTVDPMAIPLIEEVQREAHAAVGAEEAYDPADVRFLSGEQ
ncbi:MAG TPA: hypothetical protein DCZ72_12555, partial [Armatimonadetes bacterium]|nr:hypothetical protein [Armatimonadota bacterium]